MPLANKEVVHLKTGWEKIQVRVPTFYYSFFLYRVRSFVSLSSLALSSLFFFSFFCVSACLRRRCNNNNNNKMRSEKNGDLSSLGTDFEMCLTRFTHLSLSLSLSLSLAKQQTGIQKLKNLLDNPSSKNNENNGENNGNVAEEINAQEFMIHYTTCYDMCTQKPPHDYSEALYKKYKEVFEEYIDSVCIPALKSRSGEFLLRELDLRWKNHDNHGSMDVALLQLFGSVLHRQTLVREFKKTSG